MKKKQSSETLLDRPPSKKLIEDPVLTPLPVSNGKAPKTVVENTKDNQALTNQKSTRNGLIDADIKPEAKTTLKAEILADATPRQLTGMGASNQKSRDKTSELTTRAREYAVALLPSFIAKPNAIQTKH